MGIIFAVLQDTVCYEKSQTVRWKCGGNYCIMQSMRQVTLSRPRGWISFILHRVSDTSAKTSPKYMGSYLVIRDSEFGKKQNILYATSQSIRVGFVVDKVKLGAGFFP